MAEVAVSWDYQEIADEIIEIIHKRHLPLACLPELYNAVIDRALVTTVPTPAKDVRPYHPSPNNLRADDLATSVMTSKLTPSNG